jgi:hypothetical protein
MQTMFALKTKRFLRLAAVCLLGLICGMPSCTKSPGSAMDFIRAKFPTASEATPMMLRRINELREFQFVDLINLTDSGPTRLPPKPPHNFSAQLFRAEFRRGHEVCFVYCDSERHVGHMMPISPGNTVVRGVVYFESTDGRPETMNSLELHEFVKVLYAQFSRPMDPVHNSYLNVFKDACIAVLLDGKGGADEYHAILKRESQ